METQPHHSGALRVLRPDTNTALELRLLTLRATTNAILTTNAVLHSIQAVGAKGQLPFEVVDGSLNAIFVTRHLGSSGIGGVHPIKKNKTGTSIIIVWPAKQFVGSSINGHSDFHGKPDVSPLSRWILAITFVVNPIEVVSCKNTNVVIFSTPSNLFCTIVPNNRTTFLDLSDSPLPLTAEGVLLSSGCFLTLLGHVASALMNGQHLALSGLCRLGPPSEGVRDLPNLIFQQPPQKLNMFEIDELGSVRDGEVLFRNRLFIKA